MKCCETNKEKVTQDEKRTKLSGLARLGIIGTVLTCLACFTPLAVTLLGVIGLAGWAGYLDYALFPLLAVCAGLLLVGLIRGRQNETRGGKADGTADHRLQSTGLSILPPRERVSFSQGSYVHR